MIDPAQERPRHRHAPQFPEVWFDTFTASHVVAFGTAWRARDYAEEAARRIREGEVLPFEVDGSYYNILLRTLLDEGDLDQLAAHYLSSRGLAIAVQQACMTLAEAARRGQVITSAVPATGGERQTLPAHEWSERERYRFSRHHLFVRGEAQLVTKEWVGLLFWADDVRDLRANGLQRAERPTPVIAPVLPLLPRHKDPPQVIRFAEKPETLAAALRAIEEREETPSKGKLAQGAAALYWEAYGQGRARANTPEAVGIGIEKRWSSGVHARSLDWLLERAARG